MEKTPARTRLTISPKQPFRILQLTDFHSDVSEEQNEATRRAVRAMVRNTMPGLLAVTGDVWCGDEHPDAAPMWMARDIQFLDSLAVPWAFAWGNHDYAGDFGEAMARLEGAKWSAVPPGTAGGCYRIELRCAGGGVPAWDLFFINSGLRWEPAQLDWFSGEAARLNTTRIRPLPALCFFHIPLGNYKAAAEEGRCMGVAEEEVLCWGDEDNWAAPILKRAGRKAGNLRPGNVRACFCGHSHKNDFYFEEDGVIFSYGRATGMGGYGGEVLPKGGKLIELDPGSDVFSFRTVFADGTSWKHPETPS